MHIERHAVFVQQKLRSIAILKCLGSTSSQVLAVYMTQVLLLGLAGSVLGVVLAAGVIAAVPSFVGELAAMLPVDYGLTSSAVWHGLAVGMLVSILFSVVPLLEVRHVKPSLLLRQDATRPPGFDWLKWGVTGGCRRRARCGGVVQAGSVEVGLLLCAGFVATRSCCTSRAWRWCAPFSHCATHGRLRFARRCFTSQPRQSDSRDHAGGWLGRSSTRRPGAAGNLLRDFAYRSDPMHLTCS